MNRECPHCGSTEIDEDSSRGDTTCMSCGTVLEESAIVSDVTFQENSNGGHSLVGQFISKERGRSFRGVPGLGLQDSRDITHYRGRKLIEQIASQLRINQHCINTAFNFFKMCVSRNFTRGRVRSHVVAACLYMTCRLENTPHLLLDFSDVTQVNVFDLGRTLNFLTRSLRINLPTTDPCMYILRFAVLLDFGNKQREVVSMATRLVQRMKRDWIATGRRPTGLCGAALVLAARCYNFNRTIADVVRVVHISEAVVRKRLEEFGQTPSSALTIEEFSSIDLEHCEDPPSFREAQRKARLLQLKKEEEALKIMESEIVPMEEEVERALEKKRKERFKRTYYARLMSESLGLESDELASADAVVRNEIVDLVFSAATNDAPLSNVGMSSTFAPSLTSLGIVPSKNETEIIVVNDDDRKTTDFTDDLDIEGIDDDEINSYILTEEEVGVKTRFWMKVNGEYMKEMEKRRREKEEKREQESATKKRRQTTCTRKKEADMAATAQEAMEKVIHEKKLSNKINYEVLKEMESENFIAITSEIDNGICVTSKKTIDNDEPLNDGKKDPGSKDELLFKRKKNYRSNLNTFRAKKFKQLHPFLPTTDISHKSLGSVEKVSEKDAHDV